MHVPLGENHVAQRQPEIYHATPPVSALVRPAPVRVVAEALRWPGRLVRIARQVHSPEFAFRSDVYLRHNQRRQEHLATLGLPLAEKSVLEVAAGIGDHTGFFLDRGCQVLATDGRGANVEILRRRFGTQHTRLLDLDRPDPSFVDRFEVVYCYGALYHLARPDAAIAYLAERCTGMMLLETCVAVGDHEAVNPVPELARRATQAVSGAGCRPTRPWVWNRLREQFPHVYATRTQPWHDEFPLDWSRAPGPGALTRAVFVASRRPLPLPDLVDQLPQQQSRSDNGAVPRGADGEAT